MPFETTLHPAAHHPTTYMEQFCRALHPDLEMGKVCVTWFRQAIKHCTDLLSEVRAPPAYFWTTVKNFIFPDRTTEIMSQKVPISIHPRRLSLYDCQSLILDIVSDYVQRAPRYAAESAANSMLWQVLYSLVGIMILGTLFLGIVYAYYKYGQAKSVINHLQEVFKPHKRMQAIAARSLRLAKTELRTLKIKQMARQEDIIAGDGSDVLVLKVGTKYEFLETVVRGCAHSVAKLHRPHDQQHDKSQTAFKIESLNKAMRFVEGTCRKLHMVVMFEDHKCLELEESAARKRLKKSLSPPAKYSPKFLACNSKQNFSTRLDGGNASQKHQVEPTAGGTNPRPPTATATPKRHSTPRSSTTPRSTSGIPRNVQKASPSATRSK